MIRGEGKKKDCFCVRLRADKGKRGKRKKKGGTSKKKKGKELK